MPASARQGPLSRLPIKGWVFFFFPSSQTKAHLQAHRQKPTSGFLGSDYCPQGRIPLEPAPPFPFSIPRTGVPASAPTPRRGSLRLHTRAQGPGLMNLRWDTAQGLSGIRPRQRGPREGSGLWSMGVAQGGKEASPAPPASLLPALSSGPRTAKAWVQIPVLPPTC